MYGADLVARLQELDEPTRIDIFTRGMGGSIADIDKYFEEMEDCRRADERMKKIDAQIAKLPAKERNKRCAKLANQKSKSLSHEIHSIVPRHTLLDIEKRGSDYAIVDTTNGEVVTYDADLEGAEAKLAFESLDPRYDELVRA